jgi:hypothetical protein
MKTKTWKIGEYAVGGVITVQITYDTIIVINKEWDYSAGSNRGSNQSKAKELTRKMVLIDEPGAYMDIDKFLNNITTYYYAEKILDWITENSRLTPNMYWI